MPLSQPDRVVDAEPPGRVAAERAFAGREPAVAPRFAAVGFALVGFAAPRAAPGDDFVPDDLDADGFGVDGAPPFEAAGFVDLDGVDAAASASPFALDRGAREPAGFAGLRGAREDSPSIVLLITARKTTTGAATRPPPSRCRYAITP